MLIKGVEVTGAEIAEALKVETNKADYDALAGTDLFKSEVTAEGVETFLGTEEGTKFLQPKLDQFFSKGLTTWQEKNVDKIKNEAVAGLKEEQKKMMDELNTSITTNKIRSEAKLKLITEGVDKDDIDILMGALDLSKVSVDGDKIIGLNDVVGNLKESRPKWFGSNIPATPPSKGKIVVPPVSSAPGSTGKLTREQMDSMDSNERIKYKQENKDWDKYL